MNKELKQWLDDFDSGKVVNSVEMGGMGQGYEEGIQDCAVGIMRKLADVNLSIQEDGKKAIFERITDEVVEELNDKYGFSGAQVYAAQNLASVYWNKTPEKGLQTMRDMDPKRIIQIQKSTTGVAWLNPEIAGKEIKEQQYRIKPEPKCRPYTVKEMLNIITESRENRRGYPVFVDKSDNEQVFLIAVNNDSLVGKRFDNVYIFITFRDFLTDCQWTDGAICGIEVTE